MEKNFRQEELVIKKRREMKARKISISVALIFVLSVTSLLFFFGDQNNFVTEKSDIRKEPDVDLILSGNLDAESKNYGLKKIEYETEVRGKIKKIIEASEYKSKNSLSIFAARYLAELEFLFAKESLSKKELEKVFTVFSNARGLIDDFDAQLKAHLQRLQSAFDNLDEDDFFLNLNSMRILASRDKRYLSWVNRKETIAEIFEIWKKAQIEFRAQNFEEELGFLNQISYLDKDLNIVNQRKKELRQLIANLRVKELRLSALKSYENGDFEKAVKFMKDAISIQSPSDSLLIANRNLLEKIRVARIKLLTEEASRSLSLDKWEKAIKYLSEAKSLAPYDAEIETQLSRALKITSLKAQIQKLMSTPLELSETEKGDYAETILSQSRFVEGFSQSLSDKSEELEKLLIDVRKSREVAFISNGIAEIEIRGVGYIKPTRNKTVKLLPGKYKIFARCKGREDLMQDLVVPINDKIKRVKIDCGKPI